MCHDLAKLPRIHLSEGVEGFDEDRLKVPRASVVAGCEMHLVLPIQRAGEAIVIDIEKMYLILWARYVTVLRYTTTEIYDEGPVRMWL